MLRIVWIVAEVTAAGVFWIVSQQSEKVLFWQSRKFRLG
jgi:hypothetical protein